MLAPQTVWAAEVCKLRAKPSELFHAIFYGRYCIRVRESTGLWALLELKEFKETTALVGEHRLAALGSATQPV